MKKEIFSHLPDLLNQTDVYQAKRELKHLYDEFEKEKSAQLAEQRLAFEKEISELTEEEKQEKHFSPEEDPLDLEFEKSYREIRFSLQEKEEVLKAALKEIYTKKVAIIDQLSKLVHEENIAKAFSSFNELKEEWKNIGQCSRAQERELHDKHSAVVKDFYYNMNIYKELKAYDFEKNYKIRKNIIENTEALLSIQSIKEKQDKYHTLREKWYDAGPVSKDQYKELHDSWKIVDDKLHEELGEYYDKLHEEQEENLIKKKALIEKINSLETESLTTHAKWQKRTKEVLDIQTTWKKIGFAKRKENEKIWKMFRSECDLFFKKKQIFYDSLKKEQNKNKESKMALVEKAEELKNNENWKEVSDKLIKLQKDWKKIPPAYHRDEKILWQRFREACNLFFDHKKQHFSHIDEEYVDNLKLKELIVTDLISLETSGDKSKDLSLLKSFSNRWNEIGHVPFKEKDKIIKSYKQALDKHYNKIKLNDEEKIEILFQNKIDQFKGSNDPEDALYREKVYITEKINRLNSDLIQYQNNMGFLNSENSSLLDGLNRSMEKSQKEIDLLKKKVTLLTIALREY
jgi:hypothetical protein